MAYDPYYADQSNYYQDPYQDGGYGGYDGGYGGYDGGYGGYDGGYGYGEPYNPPAPDNNWVDPVKVNREYLKRIQKTSVHKGFEGLKEDGLFLFEVMARNISLKKEICESWSTDKKDKPVRTFVKFFDTPYIEVNETEKVANDNWSGQYRTNSVLATRKSFTNLFQSIYTATGKHDSLVPEVEDKTEERKVEGRTEIKNEDTASESLKQENTAGNIDATIEEFQTINIMKGKSVLIPMPGLLMIQKLQQYPLIFKVTQCDVIDGDSNVEGETLAISNIRLSETFRKAVLMSCKPDTILPLVVVCTNVYKLMDPKGWEVGSAELTLVLTCFGKGAVNCITEDKATHQYDHTYLLRHLKTRFVIKDNPVPVVDPRLAKEIVKMGLFFPSQKTSSEILQHCISSNLIPTDEQERKHCQKKRDCSWFRMVKKVRPSSSHSFDFEGYRKEVEKERAALWRQLKNICRDLKEKEPVKTRLEGSSLEDRFFEVQMIQTGVTGVETQNPFEEAAHHPGSVASVRNSDASAFKSNLKE